MKKIVHSIVGGFILMGMLTLSACSKDRMCHVPIGEANGTINLLMPDAYPLLHAGGAVRAHGGYKGLWVVNTGVGYAVFEAACPVDNEVGVKLVDGFDGVLQCPQCGTMFSTYTDGYPVTGSITQCPLYQYTVHRDGNILYISN